MRRQGEGLGLLDPGSIKGGDAPQLRGESPSPTEQKTEGPPLRVCQVLYPGLGGHGSVAFSLLEAPEAKSWKPIMAFIGVEPLLDGYAKDCEKLGVRFALFQFKPGYPWIAWWRLWRWLEAERPAAILMHGLTSFFPCYAYRLLHGGQLISIEHTAIAFKSAREWTFSVFTQRFADKVICLAPTTREDLLEHLGIFGRPENCVIIPNGIDEARFCPPENRRLAAGNIRLGMAGRFVAPQKRQDVILDALVELARLRPETSFTVTFAGAGKSLDVTKALAAARGLSDRVEFTGTLTESGVADWLRSLDIYVHAAEGENMPTAILQAMATALPVVANDTPPVRALLTTPDVCGVLVPNDGRSFAEAILALLDNPVRCGHLASTGRQNVMAAYNNSLMFCRYDALLRSRM